MLEAVICYHQERERGGGVRMWFVGAAIGTYMLQDHPHSLEERKADHY